MTQKTARDHAGNDFPIRYTAHAYAYMMLMPGLPTLFYTHYEDEGNKEAINKMIAIRKQYASGAVCILYSSEKEYIVERHDNNNNGVLLYLNLHAEDSSHTISTGLQSASLRRKLAGSLQPDGSVSVLITPIITTVRNTNTIVYALGNGYSIWTIN